MTLDPLYFYPLLAAFLMAVACSMVGVLLFTSSRLLVGETLSHAAYPGAVIGAAVFASFRLDYGFIIVAAGITAAIGKMVLEWLMHKRKTSADAALCFVLASFFGLGVLISSYMQAREPLAYKQALVYLFGQVATMTRIHVILYALLTLIILLVIVLFYKELKTYHFDKNFAILAVPRWLPLLVSIITVLALVISMRSVGVVLLSAMLVAPATAARWWSKRLSTMFILAIFFGALSAIVGGYYSITLDAPTGPMIAVTATALALISLIIAPGRGLLARFIQKAKFTWKCRAENILKAIYKKESIHLPVFQKRIAFVLLRLKGFVHGSSLTVKGEVHALQVIRLHRLFELYLTEQVGLDKDHVHSIAEDAEHYITPDIEKEIDLELNFPEKDPHKQPIPKKVHL
ncbi:MAG: metal ABC transporter permease [Chlamydiota bacterium]